MAKNRVSVGCRVSPAGTAVIGGFCPCCAKGEKEGRWSSAGCWLFSSMLAGRRRVMLFHLAGEREEGGS
ncbi:hypothetical protein KY290_010965 [Solanum tuberosum]|uniref:Uncharacterized protein n=1 Tax=Solanum tuberosum TaxID=4113 RepID=A0ABQ7VZ95_SOLTU|nr:hypothetical protein KY290_010965 [Solanum tuberosum]